MDGKRHADSVIDEVAAGQHGVVARRQLAAAGMGRRAIDRRVASGRLRVVFRGVYRVGPIAAPRSREMAAVLACGRGAVVSSRNAGAVWDCMPGRDAAEPVEITTPATERRRIAGILARRSNLESTDVVCVDGLPVTTPVRTILDLAGVLAAGELERAIARADRLDLLKPGELEAAAAARRHRHAGRVLALLQQDGGPALTRSEAEARLLDLVRRAGFRAPRANALLHGYEVDLLWAEERLVVEVDGYAFHSSPRAFAHDRKRDGVLTAAGFSVIRLT